jgi:hypothetical protein
MVKLWLLMILAASCAKKPAGTTADPRGGPADAAPAPGPDPDRPGRVTLTISSSSNEVSLDSNNSSWFWTIAGHKLSYQERHGGAHAGAPVSDTTVLTDADLDLLAEILQAQKLLADQDVKLKESEHGNASYTMEVTLDGKQARLALSGGRGDVMSHELRGRFVRVTSELDRFRAGAHAGMLEINTALFRQDKTERYYDLLGRKLGVSVIRIGGTNYRGEHTLTDEEHARLVKVVREQGLLESASSDRPAGKDGARHSASVTVRLEGKVATLLVMAPPDVFESDPIYVKIRALLDAIEAIDAARQKP